MAHLAYVDGRPTVGDEVEPRAWTALQMRVRSGQARIRMPFCGCAGHQATHVSGHRFFAHNPGLAVACEYEAAERRGESGEHRFVKLAIADAARRLGWSASVERSNEDRSRPDVSLDGHHVAVEVQRAFQVGAEYARRTIRLQHAGQRVIWLVAERWSTARLPPGVEAITFRVDYDGDAPQLAISIDDVPPSLTADEALSEMLLRGRRAPARRGVPARARGTLTTSLEQTLRWIEEVRSRPPGTEQEQARRATMF